MGFGFGAQRRRAKGPRKPMSVLTMIIIANIAVFVAQFGFGWFWDKESGIPGGSVSRETVMNGEVWRLFTYMFVHGNFLHILFNLFGVFMVGRVVLQTVGTKHFLWIYFLGGIAGALAQMAISDTAIVGASGCLFALLILFGMIMWDTPIMALIAFIPVRLRARTLVKGVVIMTIVFFIFDQLLGTADVPLVSGVAHLAHLGGAIVGFYYAKYLKLGGKTPTLYDLQEQRRRFESNGDETLKKRGWRSRLNKPKVVEARVTSAKSASSNPSDLDAILEKISANGMHSLSDEERETLDRASKEMAKKQS